MLKSNKILKPHRFFICIDFDKQLEAIRNLDEEVKAFGSLRNFLNYLKEKYDVT